MTWLVESPPGERGGAVDGLPFSGSHEETQGERKGVGGLASRELQTKISKGGVTASGGGWKQQAWQWGGMKRQRGRQARARMVAAPPPQRAAHLGRQPPRKPLR